MVTQEPELLATPTQGEVGFSQCRLGDMDDSTWFLAKELGHTNSVMYPSSFKAIGKAIFNTAPKLKLTHTFRELATEVRVAPGLANCS